MLEISDVVLYIINLWGFDEGADVREVRKYTNRRGLIIRQTIVRLSQSSREDLPLDVILDVRPPLTW